MFTWRQLLFGPKLWAIVFLITLSPAVSLGQDLSKFCAEAKSFVDQNQPVLAIDAIRKAIKEVWAHTPFHIEKAVLVQDQAAGYGMYVTRPDNVYKSGDVVRLYLEPIGFTQKEKEDHYFIGMAADFTVAKENGSIIAGQENFGKWELKNKNFATEFTVNLDYTLKGFQPGNYVIKTVLRDLDTSKTTVLNTPVRFE